MTKLMIPKEPQVPDLTDTQIEQLTEIVFLPVVAPQRGDTIFVFGGTHPGHWQLALRAYHWGYGARVIVTGGINASGVKHPDWSDAQVPEAQGIAVRLAQGGVPACKIVLEDRSRNTRENVLFAQQVTDFSQIRHLVFIGKSISAGRAYRTLVQNVPFPIRYTPFGFDAEYAQHVIARDSWMNSIVGRRRVFGEYLRIWGVSAHLALWPNWPYPPSTTGNYRP